MNFSGHKGQWKYRANYNKWPRAKTEFKKRTNYARKSRQAIAKKGIRRAYSQVRDTVLTMTTPKFYSFVAEQQVCSGAFATDPNDPVTQPVLLALHAQAALDPTQVGSTLGWFPQPYTQDSATSQAGLRSDRCYLKTIHIKFLFAAFTNDTKPSFTDGLRVIKFTPKGIADLIPGDSAISFNGKEGFPNYWWMSLTPTFF